MSLVIADADNWQGLYVNGRLFYQHHSIRDEDWIALMRMHPGAVVSSVASGEVDGSWLEDIGLLPPYLDEVIWSNGPDEFDIDKRNYY